MSTHSLSELVDKNLYSFYDPETDESEYPDNTDDVVDLSHKTDQFRTKVIEAFFIPFEETSSTVQKLNDNTHTLAAIKPLMMGIFYALLVIIGIILLVVFVI